MVHFVGAELKLLDMLVDGLLVNDALIPVDDVTFSLMTENSFNGSDVKLASRLSDNLSYLRIRVARLKQS